MTISAEQVDLAKNKYRNLTREEQIALTSALRSLFGDDDDPDITDDMLIARMRCLPREQEIALTLVVLELMAETSNTPDAALIDRELHPARQGTSD